MDNNRENGIIVLGCVYSNPKNHFLSGRGCLYSSLGIAPTIITMGGGGNKPFVITKNHNNE